MYLLYNINTNVLHYLYTIYHLKISRYISQHAWFNYFTQVQKFEIHHISIQKEI